MQFLYRWLVTAVAVAIAAAVVPGIEVTGNAWAAVIVTALVLGFLNATLGLILKIGTLGCILMSLGLFALVINAGMLWLAGWVSGEVLNLGFTVDGFWPAFWGGIIVSIVSGIANWFAPRPDTGSDSDVLV